jgi:hypothetical protein
MNIVVTTKWGEEAEEPGDMVTESKVHEGEFNPSTSVICIYCTSLSGHVID